MFIYKITKHKNQFEIYVLLTIIFSFFYLRNLTDDVKNYTISKQLETRVHHYYLGAFIAKNEIKKENENYVTSLLDLFLIVVPLL